MKDELSSYFEDPEFKETLAKYEGMVENHTPAYFDADELTDIAEYYASKERQDDADKVIDFALQLHPNDTDALILRAHSLALQGKLDEAYKVASLIEDTTDREVKLLQADLLIEENRIEEADAIFNQLAIDEDEALDTILDVILTYVDANQNDYAGKWYVRLNEEHDVIGLGFSSQQVRDVLIDYHMTFNEPENAIHYLRTTLNEYPYSTQHWNSLGSCHIQLGNFEEAHEALDFTLAIDDKNAEALALKAFCYRQSGNFQEACNYYLRLSKVSENKTRSYLALAKLYLDTHEYNLALDYLQVLLEQQSELSNYELAELYCDVALCHVALERPDKGKKYIAKALELNGNDPAICTSAGRFYLTESNDNEAAATEQFKRALEFTPEDERFDALLNIASACFDVQNFQMAVQYFEQINEEFPAEAKTTYLFLIYSYFYLHQVDPCLHYLAKMRKEAPELYNDLGTDNDLSMDENFNSLMREFKKNISNDKIDTDNYL